MNKNEEIDLDIQEILHIYLLYYNLCYNLCYTFILHLDFINKYFTH